MESDTTDEPKDGEDDQDRAQHSVHTNSEAADQEEDDNDEK